MSQTTLKGSCLCGAVKYEVTGEPTRFYHCHCSRCRKATGTGHASNLFLQPGALKWISVEQQIRSFKVPEVKRFTNAFCATCGSRSTLCERNSASLPALTLQSQEAATESLRSQLFIIPKVKREAARFAQPRPGLG